MTKSIRREIVYPQSREEVWRALTDSAILAEWLMPNDFEPRVGHRFTFRTQPNPQAGFDGVVHCEVLECVPPSRLTYSWAGGGIETRVSYRLEPEGNGTRLSFEQTGFDLSQPWGDAALRGAEAGWDRMLEQLGSVIEGLAARR
ncbi:MAG: SRPBCC domain-containing protein [Chloroflexi bacterium]|nr:SRPBCC domain-containing protein [Chloroflexota bacterium]